MDLKLGDTFDLIPRLHILLADTGVIHAVSACTDSHYMHTDMCPRISSDPFDLLLRRVVRLRQGLARKYHAPC